MTRSSTPKILERFSSLPSIFGYLVLRERDEKHSWTRRRETKSLFTHGRAAQQEVWHRFCFFWKCFGWGQVQGVITEAQIGPDITFSPDGGIRCPAISTNICPYTFIIGAKNSQQYHNDVIIIM